MAENHPRIKIEGIEKLSISSRKVVTENEVKHVTKISFEVEAPVSQIARLLYLQKQHQTLNATIECPQGEFDLNITPVNVKTGEIVVDQIPDYLQ